MNPTEPEFLYRLFEAVRRAEIEPAEALKRFEAELSREALSNRTPIRSPEIVPDLSRASRTGFAEVVFGQGKTPAQTASAVERLLASAERVLVTRSDEAQVEALRAKGIACEWHPRARMITIGKATIGPRGHVGVVSAGTTDVPVAEEAALTAEMWGARVTRFFDVGVAGLHRILERLPLLADSRVIVVAAGMEGALPSVLAGLVRQPIIAVPTSVGYGASFGGLAALLAMLNACAPGVTVVNIDNGFGAGYAAGRLNALMEESSSTAAGPSGPARGES